MEYKIYPIEEHKIISIDISGKQIHKNVGIALAEAVQVARKHGFNLFIMDQQNSVLLDSITDSYNFIENLEKLGFKRSDCFAGVINEQLDHHSFSETFGANRGWLGKFFTNRNEAIKWLISQNG